MKKMIFLFILCLPFLSNSVISMNESKNETNKTLCISASKAVTQDSLILWNKSKKLTWDNFKGKPDTITFRERHAVTVINIPFKNFNVYNDSIVWDLPCYFFINESWVIARTSDLLIHEQGHFDIAEIITRKMRKEFSNYISTDAKATTKFLQDIYNKYYDEENATLNKVYDQETNFSKDLEGQKLWNTKIKRMLDELEAYSSPHVVMKRITK